MGFQFDIGAQSLAWRPWDVSAFRARLARAAPGRADATAEREVDLGPVRAHVGFRRGSGGEAGPPEAERIRVALRLGAAEAELEADLALIQALFDALAPELDCALLMDATALLVAEHLLAPAAKPLEEAFGGPLHMTLRAEDTDGAREAPDAELTVTLGGRSWPLRLRAPAEALDTLSALFPAASHPQAVRVPSAMPVPVALVSPAFQLPAADMAALELQDVIALDPRCDLARTGQLTVDGRAIGTVTRDAASGTVRLTALTPEDPLQDRTSSMPQTDTRLRPPAPPARPSRPAPRPGVAPSATSAALETLPVAVSLELARSEMPLGDLKLLTKGAVLPFDAELTEQVTLVANGQPFARGELVLVDDRMGVRITALD